MAQTDEGLKRDHAVHQVGLLGGFTLSTPAGPAYLGHSAERLVAILALDGRALHRDVLAGRLWPELPQSRARANLRSVLWRLPSAARPVVRSEGQALGLFGVAVDVSQLVWSVRALLRGDPTHADGRARFSLREPVEALRLDRELLPGWGEEWVVIERERLRQLRLHALESLSATQSAAGEHLRAIEAGLLATSLDPLRESGHRALMRAHLGEGNYAEALQRYRALCRLLRDELGVQPSRETQELLWPTGDPALTRR
jgi:DNA-binding SARP family transcriptional activator